MSCNQFIVNFYPDINDSLKPLIYNIFVRKIKGID